MTESINELLTGAESAVKDELTPAQPEYQDECDLHGRTVKPLRTKDELTPQWLSLFLDRKIAEDGWTLQPVGTGQMSSTIKVTFRDSNRTEFESLVVKFASSDEVTRQMGLKFNHYRREAAMYRRFADAMSAGTPKCYGAVVDKDAWFTIVLEDLTALDAYVTGQLEGTDYKHCQTVLRTLARLQAPIMGDPELDKDEWLNPPPALNQELYNECLPIFLRRFPPDDAHGRLIRWLGQDGNLDAWHATRVPPFTIFHGDFRLDNILFLQHGDPRGAVAVDWGDSTWAPSMRDAAYFLGNGLKIEDRRRWEKDLMREYIDELNRHSKHVKVSWEHAWEDYRRQSIYGLAQHIPAAGMLPDTERGKIMFRTLVSRQAQHAVDMDAMSLVNTNAKMAWKPSKAPHMIDESLHIPPKNVGPLWNESWYFDCSNGELGMYARIGRLPNQDCCSFVAGIFQRGQDPILFVDPEAPLPAHDPNVQKFATDRLSVESTCIEPLKKFAFKLKGRGLALSDPSALLREDGSGKNVWDVEIDLVWDTEGQSYKQATRYEIPCVVEGTIKICAEIYPVKGFLGERNHSWGVRNWWVADWVWSGLHFDDGTHVFTIALTSSGGGSGFIQKDGKLTEVTNVMCDYGFRDNGLPKNKLVLRIEPGDLTIECETIGEAGLRFLDPEGREAHLPRVMCSAVRQNDGVKGVGWLDLNRVVKREPST